MRQTSIEWLVEQITVKEPSGQYLIDVMSDQELEDIFTKAFEMHMEEVKEGYWRGWDDAKKGIPLPSDYYDQTYGGNK